MQLLSHVDLKILKSLEVRRLLETEQFSDFEEDISEFVLDFDILKDCKNLEELHVTRFSISSPFRMFSHIRNLTVDMQTIYFEDILRYKHAWENANITGLWRIRFGQFPDKSRFMETIGLADNNRQFVHVFPSKLSLMYYPNKCIYFHRQHRS